MDFIEQRTHTDHTFRAGTSQPSGGERQSGERLGFLLGTHTETGYNLEDIVNETQQVKYAAFFFNEDANQWSHGCMKERSDWVTCRKSVYDITQKFTICELLFLSSVHYGQVLLHGRPPPFLLNASVKKWVVFMTKPNEAKQISNHLELIKSNTKDESERQQKDAELASAVFGSQIDLDSGTSVNPRSEIMTGNPSYGGAIPGRNMNNLNFLHPKSEFAAGNSVDSNINAGMQNQRFSNTSVGGFRLLASTYSRPGPQAYQQPLPSYTNRGPIAKNEASARIVPVAADPIQEEALHVLKKLKIIDNDAGPNELCTRREYARWFVNTNSMLARYPKYKILPMILIAGSNVAVFDDVSVNDLPLNVSREIIQEIRIVRIMKNRLIRKAFDMILGISLSKNRDDYDKFWENFGKNLKIGCIEDHSNHKRLAPLLRFFSSQSENEYISLDEYVENMKPEHKHIYYMAAESVTNEKNTPFLEKLVEKDYEVLFLVDPIDEVAITNLKAYKEKNFVDISKEDLDLGGKDEEREKEIQQEFGKTCDWIKKSLGDKVTVIHISNRLSSSPVVLISAKLGWSANMERLMKAQSLGDPSSLDFMRGRRVFEINPEHPIIRDLNIASKASPDDPEALKAIDLLYDTALISSGFTPGNPTDMNGKIYEMMGMTLSDKWVVPPVQEVDQHLPTTKMIYDGDFMVLSLGTSSFFKGVELLGTPESQPSPE